VCSKSVPDSTYHIIQTLVAQLCSITIAVRHKLSYDHFSWRYLLPPPFCRLHQHRALLFTMSNSASPYWLTLHPTTAHGGIWFLRLHLTRNIRKCLRTISISLFRLTDSLENWHSSITLFAHALGFLSSHLQSRFVEMKQFLICCLLGTFFRVGVTVGA
jgi:hypothetical protein